jgi:hypothetical protein
MARNKRRLRNPQHSSLEEAFALCLNQKRKDDGRNKLPGVTVEEIMQMNPYEREHMLQTNWLRERWLATRTERVKP